MGLATGATDPDVLVAVGEARGTSDDGASAWRPSRRLAVGIVTGVVAVVVLVVLVGPSGPPTATMRGAPIGGSLPNAPTSVVAERWSLQLGRRDRMALVDDRVVVVTDGDGDVRLVTARHVRSKQVLWERQLVGPIEVLLVDDDGRATTPAAPPADGGEQELARLVAIDVEDGGLLWERPGGFVLPHPSNGHLLALNDAGCTALDARTGASTWEESAPGNCEWLGDDTAVVGNGRAWEVREVDGTVRATLPASGNGAEPQAVGDLLVVQVGNRVVAFDQTGDEQWSVANHEPDSWVRGLGDLVLLTTWHDETPQSRAWDQQGHPVDLDPDVFDQALALDVDGRSFAVTLDFSGMGNSGQGVVMEVRDLDDPARVVADANGQWMNAPLGPLTAQGLLLVGTDDVPELSLRSWPRLEPVWSMPLDGSAYVSDGWTTVQTSSSGLVLAPWLEGNGRWTVHAYA